MGTYCYPECITRRYIPQSATGSNLKDLRLFQIHANLMTIRIDMCCEVRYNTDTSEATGAKPKQKG